MLNSFLYSSFTDISLKNVMITFCDFLRWTLHYINGFAFIDTVLYKEITNLTNYVLRERAWNFLVDSKHKIMRHYGQARPYHHAADLPLLQSSFHTAIKNPVLQLFRLERKHCHFLVFFWILFFLPFINPWHYLLQPLRQLNRKLVTTGALNYGPV